MDTASGDREWIDDPSRCCCVDLEIVFEEGPVPKPVRVPDVEEHIVAVLPPMVTAPPGASIARLEDYVRGPPRVDRRLDVIATTVLRE